MRRYELATPADDATLRELLRENAMPSWVTMSLEREPSYFAGAGLAGREWTVLAREDATPVGMYSCTEQCVHLNGAPVELGYLGSLRVRPAYRHKLSVVRGGYASIRRFRQARGPELWFTSIAAENRPARRLLEANLAGMPRYRFHNELVTLVLPAARGRKHALWRAASAGELPGVCDFYNAQAQRFNFSPALSADVAARRDARFHVAEADGKVFACMALWNQQASRQVVVRGYRQPLRALRPLYNAYARMARRVALPKPGAMLDVTSLAYLAVDPSGERQVEALIGDALALCRTEVLMLGLHARHPWLPRLQARFRPERYRTRIYSVGFDAGTAVDERPAQPEIALL